MSENEKASVLFVDDEPGVLKALARVIPDEPYEVRTCEDPERALEEIMQNAPTVVVADFYMPKMNGPALLKKVRALDEAIVRMVLTGKPDVTAVLDAVKQGSIYRFLLKPWDEDELKMSLLQALDHHRLLRERDTLLASLQRHRQTAENLEESHPGITALPKRQGGAYVLSEKDLPKSR